MRPAIAFRPVDHLLTIIYQSQVAGFHVGVQPFLNQHFYLTCSGIGYTYIDTFQVAAGSFEVQLITAFG